MEGVESSAHSLEDEEEAVVKSAIVHDDAASDQIGVSTNVLGNRVGDDVGTKSKWVLVDWRCERVVNDEDSAVLLGHLGELLNIEDLERWVGGSLKPDHLCVGAECLSELGDIAEVLERDVDVGVGSENSAKISLGATVDIIDAEDVITLLAEIHEGHMSGHTRAASKGVGSVLERGKLSLECESGWVAAASVVEDNRHAWSWLSVSRREVERYTDTTELLAWLRTDMDSSRGETAEKRKHEK